MDYKTAFYLIIVHHHSFLATMLNDTSQSEIESLQNAANDACGLALDAIASANSGHLGMPLGCSKIGAALFGKLLRLNPQKPTWINRDRFILSAGHGSMFLYAWLHFSGYDISLEDIKNFRKTGSKTAGHPEFNQNIGIECTTGPLGQGVANAVGMAVSCKKLAAMLDTDDQKIIDNNVVCLCGDGCLQEGVAIEACSIAGHWKLDNLIIILDANDVTLDGNLSKSQSENVAKITNPCFKDLYRLYDNKTGKAIADVITVFGEEIDDTKPYVFEQEVVGGAVPKNYFPAVEKGLAESVLRGPLAAYPVVGVKAVLYDGSYHPVDSSEMAFKVAASGAFKKGFMEASPVLLEPIVSLKVTVPDSFTGDVMGDLNKRRGRVLGMNPSLTGKQVIEAEVPMMELYGYCTQLRSMTGGAGDFEYEFARYEQAPSDVQAKEVADRADKVAAANSEE